MNVGQIVTPNSKGQIVIPHLIRKNLGMTVNTPLQVVQVGESVMLHPIVDVVRKGDHAKEAFLKILEETRGAWGPASEEDKRREERRRGIELAASRKRRKAW